jgi:hypothetical protein
MVAFLLLDLEDVLGRRLQDLLQSDEATNRAASGLFVLVVQPAMPLQPQTEAMEPVHHRRPTRDN